MIGIGDELNMNENVGVVKYEWNWMCLVSKVWEGDSLGMEKVNKENVEKKTFIPLELVWIAE